MATHWDTLETEFLSNLENKPQADRVLETLNNALEMESGIEKVMEWSALAQEALAKAGQTQEGIQLLKWRADHLPADRMTPALWLKAADLVAGPQPEMVVLIQEAGFGGRLAARECVRRLRLLYGLQPGAFCLHRTWGFGVVKKLDALYKKVEIDFNGRPGHALTLAVAASTLEVLDDDHLLVRLRLNPEEVTTWIQQEPAKVVKMFLNSFGPTPVQQLQQKLIQLNILPATDWKRFWDAARKILKTDPMVEIPAKRTEPLRLLSAAAGHDDAWFDRLSADRNLKSILSSTAELAASPDGVKALSVTHRRILANRMAFVLLGATAKEPEVKLAGAMLSKQLGLDSAECDWASAGHEFLNEKNIVPLLHAMPARELASGLEFLWDLDPEKAQPVLLRQIRNFFYPALQAVLDILLKRGAEEAVRTLFAEACGQQNIQVEGLLWLIRHSEKLEEWNLPSPANLVNLIINELEEPYMGERLKAKKQLREKFEAVPWLKATLNGLTSDGRRDFFKRVNTSPAWPGLEKQTLQANILKLYPELQKVLTGESTTPTTVSSGPVTSHRSYRERQAQLEKIINVDIPANSREIAVARSYGDLRENFEYKAAKDMQTLLTARRAELEQMLVKVRPTDFVEAPTQYAGVGTTITLQYSNGHRERYSILGEWDQDMNRHIISSSTRMAQALSGKKAGDVVEVPTEEGSTSTCILQAVEPLANEVREWLQS